MYAAVPMIMPAFVAAMLSRVGEFDASPSGRGRCEAAGEGPRIRANPKSRHLQLAVRRDPAEFVNEMILGSRNLMAEDFKKDGNAKSEDCSEHPIVKPQTSLKFRDVRPEFGPQF